MLCVKTRTSNSSHKKSTISSKYKSGFLRRCLHRDLSIGGLIDRGLPPLFGGAFVLPKQRRFKRIALIERSLHSVTLAIL
jgi:hypothetical protein